MDSHLLVGLVILCALFIVWLGFLAWMQGKRDRDWLISQKKRMEREEKELYAFLKHECKGKE